jgi:hypothetical protein
MSLLTTSVMVVISVAFVASAHDPPTDCGGRGCCKVVHFKHQAQARLVKAYALTIWQAQHAVVVQGCATATQFVGGHA